MWCFALEQTDYDGLTIITGSTFTFYAMSLSFQDRWVRLLRDLPPTSETDGGGFEPPVPFGTHAFQACTIDRSVTHPAEWLNCSVGLRSSHLYSVPDALQLDSPEQLVQWQLNTDVKFAEVRVLGADGVEPHLVNDRLDLKRVARKQGHTPLRVVEPG